MMGRWPSTRFNNRFFINPEVTSAFRCLDGVWNETFLKQLRKSLNSRPNKDKTAAKIKRSAVNIKEEGNLFINLSLSTPIIGSGYYVPRAYFTIDENGQQSPLYFVDPTLVHRVRRSPQFSSSSSTTSTSTSSGAGAGGPIFFNPRKKNRANYLERITLTVFILSTVPGFGGGFGGGFGPGLGGNNFYPQHGTSTFSGVSTTTTTGGR